jgi:hypothetical protein
MLRRLLSYCGALGGSRRASSRARWASSRFFSNLFVRSRVVIGAGGADEEEPYIASCSYKR